MYCVVVAAGEATLRRRLVNVLPYHVYPSRTVTRASIAVPGGRLPFANAERLKNTNVYFVRTNNTRYAKWSENRNTTEYTILDAHVQSRPGTTAVACAGDPACVCPGFRPSWPQQTRDNIYVHGIAPARAHGFRRWNVRRAVTSGETERDARAPEPRLVTLPFRNENDRIHHVPGHSVTIRCRPYANLPRANVSHDHITCDRIVTCVFRRQRRHKPIVFTLSVSDLSHVSRANVWMYKRRAKMK